MSGRGILDLIGSLPYNLFMEDKKRFRQLTRLLKKGKVFLEKEYLLTYSYDATDYSFLPDAVVFPTDEDDVRRVIDFASRYRIPLTPRGAGVGYSGGSLPVRGGIVICFTRMKKILNMDCDNFLVEVEPGVVTYQLQSECEKKGLFYPPDPASLKTSTLGGNVAENSGGPRCFKYGVTANYILGLEGYLMNGSRIRTGSHAMKNVAGYNLNGLIAGSEGTLMVITKIILRLLPKPEHRILYRLDFKTLGEGASFIQKVIRRNISPAVLEFMDESSLEASFAYLNFKKKRLHCASVLVEIDGNKEDVHTRHQRLIDLANQSDLLAWETATEPEEQAQLWEIRRNISPAIARLKPKKINEDIAVPIKHIPETVEYINQLGKENNLKIILFGHLGDGNIHTNLMVDPGDQAEMRRAEKVLDHIFRYVIRWGGSISGEHGIGISKKAYMSYQFNTAELALFRRLKETFDPENLLNPGKIF